MSMTPSEGMAYTSSLERRYDAAFPSTPVPTMYWRARRYEELWPLMEAAIEAGVALMRAQGKVMPPDDVEV